MAVDVWIYSAFLESARIWRTRSFLQAAARIGKVVGCSLLNRQSSAEKQNSVSLLVTFLVSVECNLSIIVSMMCHTGT